MSRVKEVLKSIGEGDIGAFENVVHGFLDTKVGEAVDTKGIEVGIFRNVNEGFKKGPKKIDKNSLEWKKHAGTLDDDDKKALGMDDNSKRKIKNMKARDKRRAAKGLRP